MNVLGVGHFDILMPNNEFIVNIVFIWPLNKLGCCIFECVTNRGQMKSFYDLTCPVSTTHAFQYTSTHFSASLLFVPIMLSSSHCKPAELRRWIDICCLHMCFFFHLICQSVRELSMCSSCQPPSLQNNVVGEGSLAWQAASNRSLITDLHV